MNISVALSLSNAGYRRRFAEAFATGSNAQRRAIARVFVRKVEVDLDTGDVWIHIIGLPPVMAKPGKQKRTPAFAGVRIGMGAGALSVVIHQVLAAYLVRTYRLRRNGRH